MATSTSCRVMLYLRQTLQLDVAKRIMVSRVRAVTGRALRQEGTHQFPADDEIKIKEHRNL